MMYNNKVFQISLLVSQYSIRLISNCKQLRFILDVAIS